MQRSNSSRPDGRPARRRLIAGLVPTLALVSSAAFVAPNAHAADVGVSVTVGQPGFYGRIDIGGYPPPPLIYPQPVIIARPGVLPPPVYMRVPPGHARDWGKHCRHYNACGMPVYFVQDGWYNDVYAPRVRGGGRGDDRFDDRGRGHGNERGHGHGKGRGHDRD